MIDIVTWKNGISLKFNFSFLVLIIWHFRIFQSPLDLWNQLEAHTGLTFDATVLLAHRTGVIFFCVIQVADTWCSPLFNWKMQKNRSFLHTNILPTLQTVKPFEIIFWVKKKRKEKKKTHFSGGEFKPLDSKYLLLNLYLLTSDCTILCSVSQQSYT